MFILYNVILLDLSTLYHFTGDAQSPYDKKTQIFLSPGQPFYALNCIIRKEHQNLTLRHMHPSIPQNIHQNVNI